MAGTAVEMSPPKARLLTVREVAALLHLGERSVWKFSACGELPAPIKVGRLRRWDCQDIEDWLSQKRTEAERQRGNLPKKT